MNLRYRLVALMPMRHSSERVPGKNYRPFGDGRPLYHHMVRAMASCPQIDKIVIDTDSPLIKEECARDFPDIVVLDRPQRLLGGMTPMTDVLLHDVSQVDSEFYLQSHSTNPLLTKQTLQRAIDAFFSQYPVYDSLFSVTRVQARLWDGLARAVNHNQKHSSPHAGLTPRLPGKLLHLHLRGSHIAGASQPHWQPADHVRN